MEKIRPAMALRWPQVSFTPLVGSMSLIGLVANVQLSWLGRVFPMTVAGFTLILTVVVLFQQIFRVDPSTAFADEEAVEAVPVGMTLYLLWILLLLPLVFFIGLPIGSDIYVFCFVLFLARLRPLRSLILGASVTVTFLLLSHSLKLFYPEGYLVQLAGW